MTYNARVRTFVAGGITFEVGAAQGVYVAQGSADGPTVVERIVVLPTGALHDLDGTADAAWTPPTLWQEFVFQAAHPNGHTQYKNLISLLRRHGTLTVGVPATTGDVVGSVAARLVAVKGTWEAPYRVGEKNELVIRAEWQLKGFL